MNWSINYTCYSRPHLSGCSSFIALERGPRGLRFVPQLSNIRTLLSIFRQV